MAISWKGDAPVTDLFAEAPDGWAFETHRGADGEFLACCGRTTSVGRGAAGAGALDPRRTSKIL